MHVMRVITVALTCASFAHGAQEDRAEDLLAFARYGVVFRFSRGVANDFDPQLSRAPYRRHPINHLPALEDLHFLGHGLVHVERTGNIAAKSPIETEGSVKRGSLDSGNYDALVARIDSCLAKIQASGAQIKNYKEVEQYWDTSRAEFMNFMEGGASKKIEDALSQGELLRYARFAVLTKLTRGITDEFKGGVFQKVNIMGCQQYTHLLDLGNTLSHDICKRNCSLPRYINSQIDQRAYDFWMLWIKKDLISMLEKFDTGKYAEKDALIAYFKDILSFMDSLPGVLKTDGYSDVGHFRKQNHEFDWKLMEGQCAKSVKIAFAVNLEKIRAAEEKKRRDEQRLSAPSPQANIFGNSPKSESESSSSSEADQVKTEHEELSNPLSAKDGSSSGDEKIEGTTPKVEVGSSILLSELTKQIQLQQVEQS